MLNKILVILAIITALLGLHYYDRNRAVEQAKNEMVASYNKELLKNIERASNAEDSIKEESIKIIRNKDEKIKRLTVNVTNLKRLLDSRPSRPKDNSFDTIPSTSCTGRELFKEDGEFLTREAARADRMIIERDYYYEQYLNLYNVLEEMRKNAKNSNE